MSIVLIFRALAAGRPLSRDDAWYRNGPSSRAQCVAKQPFDVRTPREYRTQRQPSPTVRKVSNSAAPYLSSLVAPIPVIERNSPTDRGRTRASSRRVVS